MSNAATSGRASGPASGRGAAAAALREDWGRLLALLVAQYRRLDLAEEGLGDAFEAAARTWPGDGVPGNPAAWLLTAARRRVVDRMRAEGTAARSLPHLAVEADLIERAQRTMADPAERGDVADGRLRLVLLCAHPLLPAENAAALTLRLVLGVPTEEIARLFLTTKPTMAARLTRARKRLAGASFAVPSGPALAEGLALAADIAYLAFTAGYAPGSGAEVLRPDLAAEAVRLVRVVRDVAPRSLDATTRRELDALLALVLLQHARRGARVAPDGSLVLLPDQDRSRWDHAAIDEALGLLTPHVHAPGSAYLLQALVAAEHAVAPDAAATDWSRIVRHYDALLALGESPVVRLHRAVAVAEADGPLAGLAALEGVVLAGHRLPAVRAALLERAGDATAARAAYDEALGVCRHGPERAHLAARRATV